MINKITEDMPLSDQIEALNTEAAASFTEALEIYRKSAEIDRDGYLNLSYTLINLANLRAIANRYAEAGAIHTETAEINQKF